MAALGGAGFGESNEAAAGDGEEESEEDGDGDEAGGGEFEEVGEGIGGWERGGWREGGAGADFGEGWGLGGVGEGFAGGIGFIEFFLEPEEADGELDDVFVELVFRGGGGVGLGEAGFDESCEEGGGDGFVGGVREEEAGAPGFADGVDEEGGAAGGEGALGDGVERGGGGEFFVFGEDEDDNGDVGFFGVVTEEAAEVFGLGFGEFDGGVDKGVFSEPGFGAGEEFGGDVLEVDYRGGALVFAGRSVGGGLGGEAVGEEEGDAGAEGFGVFGEQGWGGVGVFGAEGGAEGCGGEIGVFAEAGEETAEGGGGGFAGDFLPFLLVPHGEGEVVFGEAGGGLLFFGAEEAADGQ
jgi:hypothetical protein